MLVTFLLGLPIVFLTYGVHEDMKEILLFLYMFLEFLPMVLYLLAILLPSLSPHLLLPWIIINVILLLISSILALSLSMAEPTLPMVLLALAISLLLIFPILFAIIMCLPIIVYIKKLVPNYRRKIRRSSLYKRMTMTKTAEEIEREIIWRRKEQVRNVVITDRDFEQFIFVNKAAQKWISKLKKREVEVEKEVKDILDEGNITVDRPNLAEEEEQPDKKNAETIPHLAPSSSPLLSDPHLIVPPTTVYDDGKFVTDV